MAILITGASGFVGQALCKTLLQGGYEIRAIVRNEKNAAQIKLNNTDFPASLHCEVVDNLIDATNSPLFFDGVEVIIHLAGRAHIKKEKHKNPLAEYRRVNLVITRHLAERAAQSGVKRLIYLSSIKVNGEKSLGFTEQDIPNPLDAYGLSKWEAEQALQDIAKKTTLKIVILRPPLIYGKGVKANFEALLQAMKNKIPLPFSSIQNLRSLIYIENLCDIISLCLKHPNAINQTFLVSDGPAISTPELIHTLSKTLNLPLKLYRCPVSLLIFLGCLVGKKTTISRLTNSLVIDDTKIRTLLDWQPPYSIQDALIRDFSGAKK